MVVNSTPVHALHCESLQKNRENEMGMESVFLLLLLSKLNLHLSPMKGIDRIFATPRI